MQFCVSTQLKGNSVTKHVNNKEDIKIIHYNLCLVCSW